MAEPAKPKRPKPTPLTREARSRRTSVERLRELEAFTRTHTALARNQNTPLDVLERLAVSPDPAVRRQVAANRSAPEALLLTLAKDHDETIVRSLARRSKLPDSICVILAGSDLHGVQLSVVRRHRLPAEVCEILAHRGDSTIRKKLAKHASANAAALDTLAIDPDPTWALAVVDHANINPATLKGLTAHPDPAVVNAARAVLEPAEAGADGDRASEKADFEVGLGSADHRGRAQAVAEFDSLSAVEFDRLALDVCWIVRNAVAARADAPAAVLSDLARDSTLEIQATVAGHTSTPVSYTHLTLPTICSV